MTATLGRDDPPALRGLLELERRVPMPARPAPRPPRGRPRWTMGYQPGLDGLRAVSVIAVVLYHAGFGWMHGGFFGVEVFFVVSGFLITSLLLEEHGTSGTVSLSSFWARRARRLLPALAAMVVAVALVAAVVGSVEQRWQLRRDLPWSILYAANWGQIVGDVPYFSSGDPPLLRHLWSLAVEEQWYLVWPLVFLALTRTRLRLTSIAGLLAVTAVVTMAFTWWLHAGGPTSLGGPPALLGGADRTNFMYLSTITRSSGLLLGAAAAFVWRPWRSTAALQTDARVLDAVGGAAVGALVCAFGVAALTEGYVYQWLLPVVSVLSLVAVLVVVHPAALGFRRIMSWTPLVEMGRRSYGLYLWSWPIFVIVGATAGSVTRFLWAMVLTVIVAEASYRYLETPVRQGAIGRWWGNRATITYWPMAGGAALVGVLLLFYATVGEFNRFEGGDDAVFDLEAVGNDGPATEGSVPATSIPATAPTTPIVPAPSARLAIVGDSQANALAINLPDGIQGVFPAVVNGSVDGCSVHDSGSVRSSVSFGNNFSICRGWQQEWADAAAGNDVALVVVGAWDVFDIEAEGTVYGFASPRGDALFVRNLRSGVDAMLAEGANVALLEVACMRPRDVEGAGVRALPERGDDARVAHVNDLLRETAASYDSPRVEFVESPDEWCSDEAIATDLGYRWDGVHVYKPGANLIYTTIAPDLLRLAAV
jgi:peptidoglycan/LPS O-acetylase OafA/YrhL